MAFRGWPAEAMEFFEELTVDNTRAFWTAHKHVYDSAVYAPMAALLADLEPEFGHGKIFRPYRDVRFSADKSPYKTQIAAVLDGGFVRLDASGLGVGAGMHVMERDELARYRAAVASPAGAALTVLISDLAKQRIEVRGHEQLVRVPRGFPADHPRAELLKYKGIVAYKEWPAGAWLGRASAADRIVAFLRTTRPLNDWLAAHVATVRTGDSDEAAR